MAPRILLDQALRRLALLQARDLLAAGKRAEAHDALEGIRLAFLEARRGAGIELYVGRLTEFHDVMEGFVKLAESAASTEQVRAALDQASALWRRAERPDFDARLFGFDAPKYELLRKRIAAERATLDAFRLKSDFAQVYMMFGDFGGS
jgi:hypothetical protein